MEYIGEIEGFRCFRNSDGFCEGFKKVGKNMIGKENVGTDMKRIISNQKTLEGFGKYVKGLSAKNKIKDIPLKPNNLPSLFNDKL